MLKPKLNESLVVYCGLLGFNFPTEKNTHVPFSPDIPLSPGEPMSPLSPLIVIAMSLRHSTTFRYH